MPRPLAILVLLALGACTVVPPQPMPPGPAQTKPPATRQAAPANLKKAERDFVEVVTRVEPVAERICRRRAPSANCDFQIFVDTDMSLPANAFQTVDKAGRPVIVFSLPLVLDTRNQDELAFVLGHESAHHILGHLNLRERDAMLGALLAGSLAAAMGQDAGIAQEITNSGAQIGSRIYSKDYELEADGLGTVITARAGYDPLLGSQYFARIPDPGDALLGTHPPNARRQEVVREVAAGLKRGN